ncbi:MAG: GNAT family N-acetyltransferase [Chloroflexi bacterium]|nr:GNAT family N-acetyltransferase [Chloroflexota bacterium]MCY3937802.1 GNAT family N-acetyltransferase [Chloroflexota bacterium]
MSDGLKLRKAHQGDNEFAYQVKRAAFKDYAEQAWGWDEDSQRVLHERRFAEQDYRVISLDGRDVRIISVAVKPDCLFVNQLHVLPERQGQGIGRTCMLMVIDEGSKLGLPVRLQVLKVNPRALAFYERLGFAITGDTDTHFLMQSMRLHESSPEGLD